LKNLAADEHAANIACCIFTRKVFYRYHAGLRALCAFL
jgi:hypothetical protein